MKKGRVSAMQVFVCDLHISADPVKCFGELIKGLPGFIPVK